MGTKEGVGKMIGSREGLGEIAHGREYRSIGSGLGRAEGRMKEE